MGMGMWDDVDWFKAIPRNEPLGDDTTLIKVGRQTLDNIAQYNILKDFLIMEDPDTKVKRVMTWEHCILSNYFLTAVEDAPLIQPGDAGAFVFDVHGYVIGICFGGNRVGSRGYFTYIHDLFDDIKRVTGVTDIELR